MKIHELRPADGSTSKTKRLGRGIGSGLGKIGRASCRERVFGGV